MLEKIATLHTTIKGLILYTEEVNNRTNPQQLLEIRDSYDHVLRVVKFELEGKDDKEYEITNLDKAIGHLCRAGYDVLDWTSLVLKQKIEKILSGHSVDNILKVIPTYYSEMRPQILKTSMEIAEIRGEKDVGKLKSEEFTKYLIAITKIQGYYSEITDKEASLIEIREKLKWKNYSKIIIPIVAVILSVALTKALTFWFHI